MKPAKIGSKIDPESVDESAESEITIMSDGRIFAFGITRPMAALLASIETSDVRTKRLLERLFGPSLVRDVDASSLLEGGIVEGQ